MSSSYINYNAGLKWVKWWAYTAAPIYLKIYLKNKKQKRVIFIIE